MKSIVLFLIFIFSSASFGQVDFKASTSGDIIAQPKGGASSTLSSAESYRKTGDLTASEGTYTVYASKSGEVVSVTLNVTVGTSVGNQVDVPTDWLPDDWKPRTTVTSVTFDTAAIILFQTGSTGGIQMNRYNLTPVLTNFVNGQLVRVSLSWSTGN